MTLTVKDLCLPQLSLTVVPDSMTLLLASLEDHRAAGLSLQRYRYIFYDMQVDLVVT